METSIRFSVFSFPDRNGFCGLSLLRDLGSFLGSKKGKKKQKEQKDSFLFFLHLFALFASLK
jgi:hypothetical protein